MPLRHPFRRSCCPSSPTFHPREVSALIRDERPDLVVFDNAGRTAQLRAARDSGARVVYISSRPRQRRKAFRLKWLPAARRALDRVARVHGGAPSARPSGSKCASASTDPPCASSTRSSPTPSPEESAQVAARFGLEPEGFALVVPGGGGAHPGAEQGPRTMAAAALRLARSGHPTLLVGLEGQVSDGRPGLRHCAHLPIRELAALLARARVVVANGGDTLLQALSFQRICVAAPLAQDQIGRIRHCADAGIATGVELDERAVACAADELLRDGDQRARAW